MRSLEMTGGLTRGSDRGDTKRLIWLLASAVTSEVNLAMQEISTVNYESSEQHKDISTTRMAKDVTDTHKLVEFLSTG